MSDITVTSCSGRKRQRRWISGKYVGKYYQAGYYSEKLQTFNSKPRLYVHAEGESMMENLAYRNYRPAKLYRKFLPAIFEQLGLPADTKAAWKQTAGCSCGCSPGFVLDIPVTLRKNQTRRVVQRIDFWATLKGDDSVKVAS